MIFGVGYVVWCMASLEKPNFVMNGFDGELNVSLKFLIDENVNKLVHSLDFHRHVVNHFKRLINRMGSFS